MQKIIIFLILTLSFTATQSVFGQYTSVSYIADYAFSSSAGSIHILYDTLIAGPGDEIPTSLHYYFNDVTRGEFTPTGVSHQLPNEDALWVRECNTSLIPDAGMFIVTIEILIYDANTSLDQLVERDFRYFYFGCDTEPFCQLKEANTVPQNPLPVTLTSFTAHKKNTDVQLKWSTQSEEKNDFFLVQRSTDGGVWKTIENVSGSSTTTTPSYYEYTDRGLKTGEYLYRLVQVDFDGSRSFSHIVAVNVMDISSVQIFPNPVSDVLFIESSKAVTVQIFDSFGKKAFVQNTTNTAHQFDVSWLPSGVYFVLVTNDSGVEILREKVIIFH